MPFLALGSLSVLESWVTDFQLPYHVPESWPVLMFLNLTAFVFCKVV